MASLILVAFAVGVATQSTCSNCNYKGKNYPYLSKFEAEVDKCTREVCYCKCNGTAVCPPQRRFSTCINCARCSHPITGEKIDPYSTFLFDNNCYRLSCICYCDGTYSCPGAARLSSCEWKVPSGKRATRLEWTISINSNCMCTAVLHDVLDAIKNSTGVLDNKQTIFHGNLNLNASYCH